MTGNFIYSRKVFLSSCLNARVTYVSLKVIFSHQMLYEHWILMWLMERFYMFDVSLVGLKKKTMVLYFFKVTW